nr:amino acid adenylation domain-containing protein [Oceanicoccus sp. KOV_DT_Chl]
MRGNHSGEEAITIQSCFAHQVKTFPDRPSLYLPATATVPAGKVSYRELDQWSDKLGRQLLEQGVRAGDAVGLLTERSAGAIAAMLAIVKVGAHYVPLNPAYPESRLEMMLADAAIRVVFAGPEAAELAPALGVQALLLSGDCQYAGLASVAPIPQQGLAETAAYILYTSGSTGKPKGVVVPQRSILRLVSPENSYCRFDETRHFLQLAPLSFDASTFEIWGALLNGGCCTVLPGDNMPGYDQLGDIIANGVTTAWLTSSLYNTLISERPDILQPLEQLLIGGEALSVAHVRRGLEKLPNTQIINGYGPTENTTFTTAYPIPRNLPATVSRIAIGYPIYKTHCEVFDESLNPVADGQSGELIAFGDGLALGYLNRQDLTGQRFVEVSCADGVSRRGYRTGDLVVKLADGRYDYRQRNDKQVKIDGHRIEPLEIEHFINRLGSVDDARVIVRVGPQGQKRLVAYLVGQVDKRELRALISAHFPAFMVPHFIITLAKLPKNQNGKLDEAQLPDPFITDRSSPVSSPQVTECWRQILGRDVDDATNFLDAGGTSLEALRLTELLEKTFDCELDATFVFAHSTIRAQIKYFSPDARGKAQTAADAITDANDEQPESLASDSGNEDVAVIGMACRFPGAENLEQYWDNLINSRESISFFKPEELSPEVNPADANNPNYVAAKGVVAGCDEFDAAFFGISPAEAAIMDPQQRIALQLAWHALEDAAVIPGDAVLRTGVFAGMNWSRYYQQYVLNNTEVTNKFGAFNAALANESDFLSSRISYKLNLTGPSINVYTACSTGLVAIAQACQSLAQGECNIALAGGVSIATPINSGYLYQEGSMLSQDGHCRPFDAKATGTTFNDGAGFVVLKPLRLALRDNDAIYAVIKGCDVNNDGGNKASFTAPSVAGQVSVYKKALANAGVAPASIGFIETHGTATPLGDPIEVKALTEVYSGGKDMEKRHADFAPCALGSVKSNIGHTIHAAGIASFIKSVMAVKHGKIPATLHFNSPNPKLNLQNTPFYVNNQSVDWAEKNAPRRAAVSSLGVGGTNAHIILEQFIAEHNPLEIIAEDTAHTAPVSHPGHTVLITAKNQASLECQLNSYRQFFAGANESVQLRDVAYSSRTTRQHFSWRAAVSAGSVAEMISKLENKRAYARGELRNAAGPIGFMFPGQGSQRLQMGRWLYQNSRDFRQLVDDGADIILEQQGFDPRHIILADEKAELSLDVNQTRIAQPLLFLLEYGLAKYLQANGCQPDFLIGHSVGEFAAAVLAGVFDFDQALRLVAARGALMQTMPAGKMLAVQAKTESISHLLDAGLCLAAVNAPSVSCWRAPLRRLSGQQPVYLKRKRRVRCCTPVMLFIPT